MKLTTMILTVLSGISFAVCEVWVVVSFLLHLIKDTPFNWFVFWIGISSLMGIVLFFVLGLVIESRVTKANFKTGRATKGESNFQRRLREAQLNNKNK